MWIGIPSFHLNCFVLLVFFFAPWFFVVVFYWVIGAFICHKPHARFMPAMCHVAKNKTRRPAHHFPHPSAASLSASPYSPYFPFSPFGIYHFPTISIHKHTRAGHKLFKSIDNNTGNDCEKMQNMFSIAEISLLSSLSLSSLFWEISAWFS